MPKEEFSDKIQEMMSNQDNIRNIGIVSHIHHGKTTLTDNLAAAAGLMARDLVGDRMLTWVDDQERERLMTIYGATVTMPHDYEGKKYLINLLDTPGHVDFGADVTQAMRAVDGAVVMCCAVEGIMPQTETVLKQALAERVKPILFINKVDRAIKELKLTPEQLQKRLANIVVDVNKFIQKYIDPQFKEAWVVKVEDGSVAFGSALKKWAISVPFMKRTGVTFKEIIDLCTQDRDEELSNKAPMNIVVLDAVIKHLPNPKQAQAYRIDRIWKGDTTTDMGKQLLACDPNGKLAAVITKITYDVHAGMISTARIFSGKLSRGQDILIVDNGKTIKVQQVTTFIALRRLPVEYVVAGNVVGLVGLTDVSVGQTFTELNNELEAFKAIKHIFEPVVTKSIEPKYPQDLPKLIDILKTLSKEDTTLKIHINQETGETLVSGLGELHLDAKVERKIREKGVEIIVSPPIVVYRESITGTSPEIEGKSPNKHNKFYISVERIPDNIYKAMIEGEIRDGEIKGKNLEMKTKLQELGMGKDDSKSVIMIHNHNMLLDNTKGVQYLNESMEDVITAFTEIMEEGPLAREPCTAVMVRIHDVALHEDAVHRGPAQVIPAVRYPIMQGMLKAGITFMEPKQIIRIDTPQEYIGNVTAEVGNRRGEILDVENEENSSIVTAKVPVAEMFGFEGALKSATAGKGFQSMMDVLFEKIPSDIRDQIALRIRERKGLPKEVPKSEV
jgi:elongation factor 2